MSILYKRYQKCLYSQTSDACIAELVLAGQYSLEIRSLETTN